MPETTFEQCVEHAPSNASSNAWEGRLAKHATQRNATNATTPRQPEENRALETRANNAVDNRRIITVEGKQVEWIACEKHLGYLDSGYVVLSCKKCSVRLAVAS